MPLQAGWAIGPTELERDAMRAGLALGFAVAACLAYAVLSSGAMQASLALAVLGLARPVLVPLVELINNPAFVYCAALLIFLAGLAACAVYQVAVLRPALGALRRVRARVNDLPEPRVAGAATPAAWAEARGALGLLLQQHGTFVAAWAAFQADALRGRGVPGRPFSSFVAAEPSDAAEPDDLMRSLPGYFTSVGLIFTFVGLVVALYFASKGFRSGDAEQAKRAIVELLNAASFKFLTSVAALISAFLITLCARQGAAAVRRERGRALTRIEGYLALWRERTGVAEAGGAPALAPADLLRRFDALLASVADLARDVRLLAEREGPERRGAGREVAEPAPARTGA